MKAIYLKQFEDDGTGDDDTIDVSPELLFTVEDDEAEKVLELLQAYVKDYVAQQAATYDICAPLRKEAENAQVELINSESFKKLEKMRADRFPSTATVNIDGYLVSKYWSESKVQEFIALEKEFINSWREIDMKLLEKAEAAKPALNPSHNYPIEFSKIIPCYDLGDLFIGDAPIHIKL